MSHSAGGEDLIVSGMLNLMGIKLCNVKYIDVGANNPIISNNTYYFYEKGASGILVEANKKLCENLKRLRKRDIVINRAVYVGTEETVPLYIVGKADGLSSLKKEHILSHESWSEFEITQIQDIQTININEVFAMMKNECDVFSIDIEGYDLMALKSLDLSMYRPKIIITEMNWEHESGREYYKEIMDYLEINKYVKYVYNSCNVIFLDKQYAYLFMDDFENN